MLVWAWIAAPDPSRLNSNYKVLSSVILQLDGCYIPNQIKRGILSPPMLSQIRVETSRNSNLFTAFQSYLYRYQAESLFSFFDGHMIDEGHAGEGAVENLAFEVGDG